MLKHVCKAELLLAMFANLLLLKVLLSLEDVSCLRLFAL